MKHVTTIVAVLALLCSALPATAQAMKQDDMQHDMSATAAPKVSGEIRKVDVEAGKITIRHGEIPNLEMPPMTMVFRAAAPELLSKLKAGDQVWFTAAKINGALTVTSIGLQQ